MWYSVVMVFLRHRTMKQIVIAVIFFSFWGVIGGTAWLVVREPAPLPTPTPREARPLEGREVYAVRTPDGKVDVIGMIVNTNTDAGAVNIPYAFRITQAGAEIHHIEGETYVLPSLPSYVTAFGLELPEGKIEVELEVGNPQWRFVAADFISPSIVRVTERKNIIPANPDLGRPELFEVKGLLANESPFGYQHVDIVAVGKDYSGEVVGFGATFAGEFLAGERREATIQWPVIPRKDVHTITWFASVNVFASDAVILSPGDPDPGIVPRGSE